jgi:hypothetical protein
VQGIHYLQLAHRTGHDSRTVWTSLSEELIKLATWPWAKAREMANQLPIRSQTDLTKFQQSNVP